MKAFVQKIRRILFHHQKTHLFDEQDMSVLCTSGLQDLWLTIRRYLRKLWSAIYETKNNFSFFIRWKFNKTLSILLPVKDGTIFISHNATATGAPITLLNQAKAYKQVYGDALVIILISGGELLESFQAVAPVFNLYRRQAHIKVDENINFLFLELKQLGYSRCIANTVISGSLQRVLAAHHIETIYEIHELLQTISKNKWDLHAEEIAQSGSLVVFPARYVADKFSQHFKLPPEYIHIIPQGISLVYKGQKSQARKKLLDQLALPDLPSVKIVLGAGHADHRKGTDLFFEVAEKFYQLQRSNVHFIWLGNRDQYFEHWKNQTVPKLPYKENIHLLDFTPQPDYIFAGTDLFLLTSREDPFPSVALEALANNTPVITFKDTGGIEEIIDRTNGAVVEHLNTHRMAEAAWEILQNPAALRPSTTKLQTYPEYIQLLTSLFHRAASQ